jgi:protein-tyrosine phosphatase
MMGLNLSWVAERLAVGGSFARERICELAEELSVRAVVDLRAEDRDDEETLTKHGVRFLHLPTDDHCAISLPMLDAGVAWVTPRLASDERVYIHCEHGIGRSVLLCMCVLVETGDSPMAALRRIKDARPKASPSPVQLEVFLTWCGTRSLQTLPAWQDLADVAYAGIGTGSPSAS